MDPVFQVLEILRISTLTLHDGFLEYAASS